MKDLLVENLKQLEIERYEYLTRKGVTVLFQRLAINSTWYAISANQIVGHSKYRHDLEEWCDLAL